MNITMAWQEAVLIAFAFAALCFSAGAIWQRRAILRDSGKVGLRTIYRKRG